MNGPASRSTTALMLSPHLDDVGFSCGGTVSALRRRGWRVIVATIFTASVPDPSGFALACQLDKGLPPEIDYMAIRRDEDAAFGRAVAQDLELRWLGLPEAPHRGYDSAASLFDEVDAADPALAEATRLLGGLLTEVAPDLVFAPQAAGGHVDHRQVVGAILGQPGPGDRLAWYRDLPYAEKFPGTPADPRLDVNLIEVAVEVARSDLAAKLDGCARYASQVPFQFGSEAEMRRRLDEFASAEASRFGRMGHAETFLAPANLVGRHADLFLQT